MRALFVHDHPFLVVGERVFSDKLPYSTWQRYLQCFDALGIYSRSRLAKGSEPGELPLSSGDDVQFTFGHGLSSLRTVGALRIAERLRLRAVMVNYDVVIARLPSEYGLMAVSVANELGKPYMIEVVGCAWDALWNYGGLKSKAYAPILTWRMRNAVFSCKYVSYVSQEFLQFRYPAAADTSVVAVSNVEIPEPGIDTLAHRLARDVKDKGTFSIGLIGSFKTRYKGIHIAIPALARLRRAIPSVELRVLGGGDAEPYKAMAEKWGVGDAVFFDGELPSGDAVFRWLDSIDLYVQPSFQEGVPRALIEAMSRGCPAVASSAGGIPELLDPSCIFEPGDITGMADLLRGCIVDKDWMSVQARRNFDLSKRYTKSLLDSRRKDFLLTFRAAAELKLGSVSRSNKMCTPK